MIRFHVALLVTLVLVALFSERIADVLAEFPFAGLGRLLVVALVLAWIPLELRLHIALNKAALPNVSAGAPRFQRSASR